MRLLPLIVCLLANLALPMPGNSDVVEHAVTLYRREGVITVYGSRGLRRHGACLGRAWDRRSPVATTVPRNHTPGGMSRWAAQSS
jgi:hypothetical protein